MNDKEKELLRGLRGPSAQFLADAKRYVRDDAAYRAEVDATDEKEGTSLGKELRAVYFGTKEPEAPVPVVQPTAEQVAAAVRKFPQERCVDLYKRKPGQLGEVLSNLSKAERDEAKLAAQFFKVLPSEGGSSVRFNYETSRDRAAKREAKEAAAKAADQRQADTLPPGVNRDAKGNLVLADEAAFTAWKQEKAARKDAIAFLEQAGNSAE
jgi:hypothetical protein